MRKKVHDFPINVRVNGSVAAAARDIAHEAGISFAALVRECLTAVVERRPALLPDSGTGHVHYHDYSAAFFASPEGRAAIVRAVKEATRRGDLPR